MRNVRASLVVWLAVALAAVASADVFTNVPEATGYKLIYELDIPTTASNLRNAKAPTYSVNNAASAALCDRIAYYLELDTGSGLRWVYASMDSFELNAYKIGLPHNVLNPVARQQVVSNMNVYTNVPGTGAGQVQPGTGIATGSIEMWPSNYSGNVSGYVPTGSNSFDWNDSNFNTGAGHSTFQVHNWDLDGAGPGTAGQTLLSYNRYGHSDGNPAGAGIGNDTGSNTDWTFSTNASTYTVAKLQVLVHEVPVGERPAMPGDLPAPNATIQANVPEADEYRLVYQLPISSGSFNPSQYTVDNSDLIPDGSFRRIAYYVELQSPAFGQEWVWVSMDAFNLDADLIGVPNTAAAIQQMIVNNMNVVASAGSGVTSGEGLSGNIEFWNTNYGGTATNLIPGGASTYDYDDYRSTGGNYASMQVHNYGAQETLFAFNHWNSGTPCLGIGNNPSGNPDWTFTETANQYTVKNLYVFVAPVPEPATLSLLGLGALALVRRRRKG